MHILCEGCRVRQEGREGDLVQDRLCVAGMNEPGAAGGESLCTWCLE